jgi:hypothetical protein
MLWHIGVCAQSGQPLRTVSTRSTSASCTCAATAFFLCLLAFKILRHSFQMCSLVVCDCADHNIVAGAQCFEPRRYCKLMWALTWSFPFYHAGCVIITVAESLLGTYVAPTWPPLFITLAVPSSLQIKFLLFLNISYILLQKAGLTCAASRQTCESLL